MDLNKKWDWKISHETHLLQIEPSKLWSYRHFVANLVSREFKLNYQQTVLGPIWILFQPLLTLLIYTIAFGKMVKLPIGTIPPVLFYFSGIILWGMFTDIFNGTSNTFRDNGHVFNKVYFPRIIVPVAMLLTHLIRFGVQFVLLVALLLYYLIRGEIQAPTSKYLLLTPACVLLVGSFAFSIGLILSIISAKYRDVGNLAAAAIRLLMFITPVIYPLSLVDNRLLWVLKMNPLTQLFETFRFALFQEGSYDATELLYSSLALFFLLFFAVLLFNKRGDHVIDVI